MKLARTLLAVVAVMTAAGASYAGGFSSAANGDWNDPNTWGQSGTPTAGVNYPGASDTATINHDVNVTANESVSSFSISISAILKIEWGKKLSVSNSADSTVNGVLQLDGGQMEVQNVAHSVNVAGTILMSGSDPELTIDRVDGVRLQSNTSRLLVMAPSTNPAVIDGAGNLLGLDNASAILIGSTDSDDIFNEYQLTVQGAIKGAMTVTRNTYGTADFENDGIVQAQVEPNSNAVLKFLSLDSITDGSTGCTPEWLSDSSATLEFATGAGTTALGSAFSISGTLCVDTAVTVQTTGHLFGNSNTCGGSFSATGTCP